MSQIPRVTAVDIVMESAGATLRVVGDLDLASAQPFLDRALTALDRLALDRGGGDLTVDMSGVGFCDSSGLTALIRVRQRCTERGWHFRTVNLQPPVRRVVVDYGGLGEYLSVE